MSALKKSVALYDERGARLWEQAESQAREEIPVGGDELREGEVLTWILAKHLGLTPVACCSNQSPQIYHTKECHQVVDVHVKIKENLHSVRQCGHCREFNLPDKIEGMAVDTEMQATEQLSKQDTATK